MTIFRIPVAIDEPSFFQRTPLDGVDYILNFDYNGRQDRWYLSVQDAEGSPIVSGILLTLGQSLLDRYTDTRLPPGFLVCLDLTGDGDDPGYSDLWERVRLTYYDATEFS